MATDVLIQNTFDPAVSFARQAFYRYLALALADPRSGSWTELRRPDSQRLVSEAAALIRSLPSARPVKLAARELPLEELNPGPLIARLPDSHAALAAIYEEAFGLLAAGPCPPLETEYIQSKLTFQRSHQMADVSGFYRAFGLQPSTAPGERHDHITLELEFMATLISLERSARLGDGKQGDRQADVCRDAQKQFLADHLAWWAPAFGRLLALEHAGGFHEAVGRQLAAWIPSERASLGVPVPSGIVHPTRVERPEECDGCMLASQ